VGVLKLPKYLKLPDGTQPSILCKRGDISKYVILTNTIQLAERVAAHMAKMRLVGKGDSSGGFAETAAYNGFVDGLELTAICSGIGSGHTSTIIEELINIGARVLIQVGATGAMQEDIDIGDIVIPAGAVRDEGTTPYYAPLQYPAMCDYRVVNALVEAAEKLGVKYHVGIVRTTDGLYPSQRIEELVSRWKSLGVLSVDQEVSAILTVPAVRGAFGGAALAVVGNLVQGKHYLQGDVDPESIKGMYENVIRINIDAARILNKSAFPPE
jgi:uridine phosphorylase